ncbi:hypothetical protein BGZ73_001349, partial [Actinomortierella ambigua]
MYMPWKHEPRWFSAAADKVLPQFPSETVVVEATCSAEGAAPEVQEDCGSGLCIPDSQLVSAASIEGVFKAADATCAPPCKCPGSEDICASSFPPECGFGNTSILSCSGLGATPVVKGQCSGSE